MAEQLLVAAGQILVGRGVVKDVAPDLIIGTVPAIPTAVVTYILSKLSRTPYIIDLRDAWPDLLRQADQWNTGVGRKSAREVIAQFGPLQVLSRGTEISLNIVLRNSSAILVTSANLRDNLQRRRSLLRRGRRPRVEVIRNVFPLESSWRKNQSKGYESDATLKVLYAGTIGRAQNLLNALEAAKLAEQQGVHVSLTFVGAGASKENLKQQAEQLGVDAAFVNQQLPGKLDRFYTWADTALVHLTEWEPLERTVPSKTYELMERGIHISAVVQGEAAELVRKLKAGDVVEPGDPTQLAALWIELASDRSRLRTTDSGRRWVVNQRMNVAPSMFLEVINGVCDPSK
ncbi:glycosyltransferase [Corynebacterium sp. p3-SID1056]|uniref:glycosyltransferase n=1 Tax=Corynebacterium sp. p3-SID1056 TaxID=2916092 RepID=UPI0021A67D6A|nr:glycosyltransferase [Corynebacterium sp. p3-SID1056]MCT2339127.1 glycosyltransferase [Corynebacterium sp. p3-SID1056]